MREGEGRASLGFGVLWWVKVSIAVTGGPGFLVCRGLYLFAPGPSSLVSFGGSPCALWHGTVPVV